MDLVPWRIDRHESGPDVERPARRVRERRVGDYAGRGRYIPRDADSLSTQLSRAIGKFVHLELAGVAVAGQAYAGQRLYRECRGTALLAGAWVPEQDLDFPD